MATAKLSRFLRALARGMAAETLRDQSDRHLVEMFLASRDEAAFEMLVRRHGPMVYRVCWRVLQQAQDSEDALQATFLLLAQKLRTVRNLDSLASWLHGVAHRVALKAKAKAATRRRHEHASVSCAVPMPSDEITWGELRTVLDAELAHLPEKLRLPLILCYLEARTQEEAASQLGWSKSTLLRRLQEARTALGCQLTRRGVVWPAALSAVLLSDCVSPAALPSGLIVSTVDAVSSVAAGSALTSAVTAPVAALTEGVVKAMFTSKLKVVAAAILLAVSGVWVVGLLVLPSLVVPATAQEKGEAAREITIRVDGPVSKLAWSPDGKALATVSVVFDEQTKVHNSTIRLWDAAKGELKLPFGEEKGVDIRDIVFFPNGKTLVISVRKPGEVNGDEVRIMDAENGAVKKTIPYSGQLGAVAVSPDGKTLGFGGMAGDVDTGFSSDVKLWDLRKEAITAELTRKLEVKDGVLEKGHVTSLAFSYDGKVLAAAETDNKVRLWDSETGKLQGALEEGHSELINQVAFSADGKTLVSGGNDALILWDVRLRKIRKTLSGHKGWISAVAFGGSKIIATGGGVKKDDKFSGEVLLWDAKTGELKQAPRLKLPSGGVSAVAFRPDGKILAVGSAGSEDGKAKGEVRLLQID